LQDSTTSFGEGTNFAYTQRSLADNSNNRWLTNPQSTGQVKLKDENRYQILGDHNGAQNNQVNPDHTKENEVGIARNSDELLYLD
jgi:hypothetical protein